MAEKGKGDFKFTIYPGGVMGDEDEMLRKIKSGQLNGGGFTIVGIKEIAPEFGVLDVPMLFRNYDEVDRIIEKFFTEFEKIFEKRGFKLILLSEQGFSYFFSVRKDINSLKDIGKTRCFGWKNEKTIQFIIKDIFGTNPILISLPDLSVSIGRGIIETFDTGPMTCISLQWCRFVNTVIDLPFRFEPAVLIIDTKT